MKLRSSFQARVASVLILLLLVVIGALYFSVKAATNSAVRSQALAQLDVALSLGVDVVLLDNMSLDDLRTAVAMCKGRAITEASGRITPETAPAVAATGVDQIAVGWLTHSAKVLDIGLDA